MAKATLAQCEAALRKHLGVIAHAAEELGLNRSTLWERVQKSERLQRAITEVEESTKDIAEGKLGAALRNGEAWAVRYYLTNKAKDRGYGKSALDEEQLEKLIAAISNDPAALRRMADGE
jgi:hypothetical protein